MALADYLAEEVALDCVEGRISRRDALRRLGLLGLTAAGAVALLTACGGDDDDGPQAADSTAGGTGAATTAGASTTTSGAATTPPPSGGTTSVAAGAGQGEEVRFAGPQGELLGVVAEATAPRGAVLVIHENRGLTPHIRTIPARLAGDGYTALAIDLLSEEGGTAGLPSEGDATAALAAASADRMVADLRAGLDELERRAPGVGLAAVGFCFGGGMTWQLLAAGEPRLRAAVPFYGPAPASPDFTGSPNAAVLGIYAGQDSRVNATRATARAALEEAGLTYELRTFDGVDHAFFNDTGPRYAPEAAAEAYAAMLDWFAAHLS